MAGLGLSMLLVSRCRTCVAIRHLRLLLWLRRPAGTAGLLVCEHDAPAMLLHAGASICYVVLPAALEASGANRLPDGKGLGKMLAAAAAAHNNAAVTDK